MKARLETRLRLAGRDSLMEFYRPETFLPYCQACPDYGARWSCPPYDEPLPRLEEYAGAYLLSVKILYDGKTRSETRGSQAVQAVYRRAVGRVKILAEDWALEQQRRLPGSLALACGGCQRCPRCARQDGLPCRRPETPRFSLESMGFDAAGIADKLLGQTMLWAGDSLPAYHLLIGGLLWPGGPAPEEPCLPPVLAGNDGD